MQLHRNNNLVPWLFLPNILPIPATHFYLHTVSIANASSIVTWPSSFTITFLSSNTPSLINGVAVVIPVWLTIILVSPIGSVPVTSTPIVTHISYLWISYLDDLLLLARDLYFLLFPHDP